MGDVGGRQGLKASIRVKPKTTPLSTNKADIENWLENQPDVLEIQRKMDFDALKEVLQNWLAPKENDEVATETEEDGDLPWEKDAKVVQESAPKTNYTLKTDGKKPKSKADAFEELFEDEDK